MLSAFFSFIGANIMFFILHIQSSSCFPKPLSAKEEREYLGRMAQGDPDARAVLIERNLRLVSHICKKYYSKTNDNEDLISIGTIGLIKAVDSFDYTKGTRLSTYASRCVENEILMYFRSTRKSAQDVSLSDYIETGTDGAPLELMDVICEDCDLLEQVSDREAVFRLRQAMGRCLTEQERTVVILRYGLGGRAPLRQRQVAERLGISRSYISRIEKRALQKLRKELE